MWLVIRAVSSRWEKPGLSAGRNQTGTLSAGEERKRRGNKSRALGESDCSRGEKTGTLCNTENRRGC